MEAGEQYDYRSKQQTQAKECVISRDQGWNAHRWKDTNARQPCVSRKRRT